jgi:hypothetical protein
VVDEAARAAEPLQLEWRRWQVLQDVLDAQKVAVAHVELEQTGAATEGLQCVTRHAVAVHA